ncbi:amidohydrolase family protein [Phreatobacter stygius]|uniref:Amidohydrolase n=1 Tax=Phreatobacter stygius TaxID=1940610 RepID=A0A4D7B459_9HYPH|nr:amidohydrolase family protein [Phreatobacter stygius]QCI66015.1 amidohydrolase [Phreatobacter stygius]
MLIDAHQHFWSLARGDYGWLTPALGPIHRDFGPADLGPLIARHGIARTILVQAAPTPEETEFLLAIARDEAWVAGVIGWADFAAADAPAAIARLSGDPLLVGLRPMVQDIADDDWLIQPSLRPAFEALAATGLVFDALVLPRHLPRLLNVAKRHPDLTIVIDHLAKPPIAEGRLDPWRADMAALAALPNVACKLSGMVTEAGPGWTTAQLAPYAAHVLAVFDAERLLWGSDWPVATLAAGYDDWVAATGDLLGQLSPESRAAVLGGNAARIYLGRRGRGANPA